MDERIHTSIVSGTVPTPIVNITIVCAEPLTMVVRETVPCCTFGGSEWRKIIKRLENAYMKNAQLDIFGHNCETRLQEWYNLCK